MIILNIISAVLRHKRKEMYANAVDGLIIVMSLGKGGRGGGGSGGGFGGGGFGGGGASGGW
jgi:uncharacterized membrane protein YgcG